MTTDAHFVDDEQVREGSMLIIGNGFTMKLLLYVRAWIIDKDKLLCLQ